MKRKNYFTSLKSLGRFAVISAALLSATFSQAQNLTEGLKLHYTFEAAEGTTVPDVSGNGYPGTLIGATVGMSNGKNSLILGTSGTDYLDMGANTGNLISTLTDFSMSCYVWVNSTYTSLNSNGNMIATFANSLDSYANSDGYMFLQAKRSRYSITTARYETEQAVQIGQNMAQGKWVHFTYTQAGTVGKLYIDGVLKNTNEAVTLTPSSLGATPYNMLARPSYASDKYLQDAQISDFRIYNRSITGDEVLMLNGYPADLIVAYGNLALGDLTSVTGDITLPALSDEIPVTWTSSLPDVIGNDGKVTRPEKYDATVKLTATLTKVSGEVTYKLTKEFTAIVKAFNVVGERLAKWDFNGESISEENGETTVTDASESKFVGTLKNEARIRTIGTTDQINVLDLGNGTGYFDMGQPIGEAIYALNNYTMCAYFRVDDDYAEIGNAGNFIWTFSNTDNAPVDQNGYIIALLRNQSQEISTNYWQTGNQGVYGNTTAAKGGWHHFAYTQNGNTGTIFVDGVQLATGTITNLPAIALAQPGRKGTLYNWLGRSCYPSDGFLRKTLLYDFQLLSVPMTGDDLNFGFEVPAKIEWLNNAYAENPDVILPELTTEQESFTISGLDAVSSNLTLPAVGTIDPTVKITWVSSNTNLIDNNGVVTRPDYYDYNVTLTAKFSKNGQKVSKVFTAKVLAKEGTAYTNDLLIKHDFESVSDTTVYDAAEKRLAAKLMNGAKVVTMGTTNKYKVVDLGDSIGYIDLGAEVGKIMYHQNDYTIGAYYRIDENYEGLSSNGNFIWTFANTVDPGNDPRGYIIGILKDQSMSISPRNWDGATGNQAVGYANPALKGGWHHFGYTQSGTSGTVYIDGLVMAQAEITNTPATTLARPELLGSAYNWIGRSCYPGDVYLRNTLISDFRVYSKALTDLEIQSTVLNVGATIDLLNAAYAEGISAVRDLRAAGFNVIGMNGAIKITGLSANDKLSVFDLSGRRINSTNRSEINVASGVYIVRINDLATKVIVE